MQLDLTLVGRAREALGNGNVFGALRDLDAFLARHPVLTPDDIVHQAEEIDRAAYKKRVNDLVDEIGELWRTGYFDGSRSAFDRYVEEDLEGQMTDWREARQCLYFSDNAGAAHNQLGVEALDWGGGVPWC